MCRVKCPALFGFTTKCLLKGTVEEVNTTLALCWWEEGLRLHGEKTQEKKI